MKKSKMATPEQAPQSLAVKVMWTFISMSAIFLLTYELLDTMLPG